MKLFVTGLNFKTAPVSVRERLAVAAKGNACRACRLKIAGNLSEVVLVSTCNRVEVYGSATKVNGNIHGLFRQFGIQGSDLASCLYVKEGEAAAQHLFSVASGLDSMVVGETEITGQVKNAYQLAKDAGHTGPITNRWFQTALQVAKEVRTKTNIGRGSVSVGSVAVDLVGKIYADGLTNKTVLIIGAGKMGEACVNHLVKKGASSVIVVNRSIEKAELLAAQVNGRAMRFDELPAALREADIVISSTGAGRPILHGKDLVAVMASRPNRPLALVDIAVPRDFSDDVQDVPGVYLYNIDDLQAIITENARLREGELARCQTIVAERSTALLQRLEPASGSRSTVEFNRTNGSTERLTKLATGGYAACH